MKTLFYTKTLIALAVAVAAAAAAVSQAQEQPIPPPSQESSLPADIVPGTPLADVVKMVQAGVDANTIRSYIVNSQSAFNLDADKIIYLKDMGVPSDLVNAMMDRDKTLYASNIAPPPAPAAVTTVASVPDTAPPPAEVTVNYFYNTLSPYGTWVDVDGYGRCWRPTVVVYDSNWRPYCDRGHWVYTDCGWYWDSDYSWGIAFHYGRWFHHARFGWCWYPDTVWAPSWVAWRSGGDYCGWAPLPPYAEFRPGLGFYYRGASVAFDFDFGLGADAFLFVAPGHFCDRHPRSFCVDRARVPEVFHHTTFVNNYVVHDRFIANRGIDVDRIRSVTHRNIEPVHVGSLPHADRQGWRGDADRAFQHGGADNHGDRGQFNRDAGNHDSNHHDASPNRGMNGNNIAHDNHGNDAAHGPANSSADSIHINHRPDLGNVVVSGGDANRRGNRWGNDHNDSVPAGQNNSSAGGTRHDTFGSTPAEVNHGGSHNDSSHSSQNGSPADAGRRQNFVPPASGTAVTDSHTDSLHHTGQDMLGNRGGSDLNRQQWRRDTATTGDTHVQSPQSSMSNSGLAPANSRPTIPANRQFGSDSAQWNTVNRDRSSYNHDAPAGLVRNQQAAAIQQSLQPTVRSENTDRGAFGDRGNSQANWHRNSDAGVQFGSQQHGAAQLEQHSSAPVIQPRIESHATYAETAPRSFSPPSNPAPAPVSSQSRGNSGSNNGGSNGGNSGGHNSDNNRQNH